MPITPNYTWKETSTSVELSIPLKGTSISKVDIFLTDTIVKISFAQYLLDLNLTDCINEDKSKAISKNSVLLLNLVKVECNIWEEIDVMKKKDEDGKCIMSKKDIATRRKLSIEKRRKREEELKDKVRMTRLNEERTTLRNQMSLEQTERDLIDNLKAKEKKNAEDEVYKTLSLLPNKINNESDSKTNGLDDIAKNNINEEKLKINLKNHDRVEKENIAANSITISKKKPEFIKDGSKTIIHTNNHPPRLIPAPRKSNVITMNLTPRIFKTPKRESTKKQEKDFITKYRPYLKNNHLLNHSKTMKNGIDNNPFWLKQKGDEFFEAKKDYLSAINVYSEIIKNVINNFTANNQSDKKEEIFLSLSEEEKGMIIDTFINRSLCYYNASEYEKCVHDCQNAIKFTSISTPLSASESNHHHGADSMKNKSSLFLIMAIAQSYLHQFESSIQNFDNVTKFRIQDNNGDCRGCAPGINMTNDIKKENLVEVISKIITKLKTIHQATLYKKRADKLLLSYNKYVGNTSTELNTDDEKAILDYYNKCLATAPDFVSTLSNRSAYYLVRNDYNHCIDDCTKVVELLQCHVDSKNESKDSTTNATKFMLDDIENVGQQMLAPASQTPEETKLEIIIQSTIQSFVIPSIKSQKGKKCLIGILCRRAAAKVQKYEGYQKDNNVENWVDSLLSAAIEDLKIASKLMNDGDSKQDLEKDIISLKQKQESLLKRRKVEESIMSQQ